MIAKIVIGVLIGGGVGSAIGYFSKCASGACPLTATPFRGALYGAVLGALFGISMGKARPIRIPEGAQPAPGEGLAYIFTQEVLTHYVTETDMPCLVDFYSDDCPPCLQLGPTIEKLAEKYRRRAVVCKVNTVDAPELAASFNINAIPAVLFFENGQETERLIGLRPQKDYEEILNKMLGTLPQ